MSILPLSSALLCLLALLAMADVGSANLCSATRAPGGSKSNSGSQQAKECDVDTICTCSYTSTSSSSAAPSTSASSSSASPSTSSSSASPSTASSTASSSSSASPSSSSTNAASTGTTPVSMANEPCPCVLIQELLNMKYLYLSYSQQLVFEVCLNEIRTILVDVTITIQVKVSKIALSLKNHFKKYPDIKKLLKFKKIAGWGRLYSLLDAGTSFDSAHVDSLITIDVTGESNVTAAISNGTANDACGAGSTSAIAAVLGRVKKMFKKQTPGYHKGRKMGYFKKAMVKYLFVANPSIESCVRNVSVPGFGNVDQFLSLCDQYETSSSLSTSLLNGTATDNAVVQSLNNSLNSNATVNSTDAATLSEAMNYVNNLTVYFTSTSDVVLRLKFLSAQFSMLSSACRVLLHPIEVLGTMLTVDFTDIVSSSHFCDNNGCGNITAGAPSMTYPENTLVDTVYNISDIEEACQTFNATLTPMQALSFKTSTYNGIQNCVRGSTFNGQPLTDMNSRYSCAVYYVSNYAKNQPTLRANFLGVELYSVLIETSTTVSFSNVGGFCGCS